ncbi:hypothetical protein JCM10212_005520 [Sporobolomyces blumeae]
MSHSTPSQAAPPLVSRPLAPPPSASSSRFSPYHAPLALRTSLFSRTSVSGTPLGKTTTRHYGFTPARTVALPPPALSTSPPVPFASTVPSSFGPTRSSSFARHDQVPLVRKPKDGTNPFQRLSATEFDSFVQGLRDKVKNALDPEVERKRKREERDERNRIRARQEQERIAREERAREEEEGHEDETEDVFGEVKKVGRPSNGNVDQDMYEKDEEGEGEEEEEQEEEDEEDSVSSASPRGSAPSAPAEIVVLDSDSEEEQEQLAAEARNEPTFPRKDPNRRREDDEDSIVDDEVFDDDEIYDEEGEEEEEGDASGSVDLDQEQSVEEEEEEEEDEEDVQPLSSRSPTPTSQPSFSPRKPHIPSSPPSRIRQTIDYPELSTNSARPSRSTLEGKMRSSSPDHEALRPIDRDQVPLFRPRNEGSASATEGSIEYGLFGDSGEGEGDGDEEEGEEEEEGDEYEGESYGVNQDDDEAMGHAPPPSQFRKRDPFGRPIRYDSDGEGLEAYDEDDEDELDDLERECGYAREQDQDVAEMREVRPHGGLEDAETLAHFAAPVESNPLHETGPNDLGTIDLVESDQDEEGEFAEPSAAVEGDREHHISTTESFTPLVDLESTERPIAETEVADEEQLASERKPPTDTSLSEYEIQQAVQLVTEMQPPLEQDLAVAVHRAPSSSVPPNENPATATVPPAGSTIETIEAPGPTGTTETIEKSSPYFTDLDLEQVVSSLIDVPAEPATSRFLNRIGTRDFAEEDFRTPDEAQEDLLDVDQVRVREAGRLPFLEERRDDQDVFAGYTDEDVEASNGAASVDAASPSTEPPDESAETERGVEREGSRGTYDLEEEEEFFGQGVPGDEVEMGREVESDQEGGEGRGEDTAEDSEDLGSRIPWQAKGKNKAIPSPSIDSDDPSRSALSDSELPSGAEFDGSEMDEDEEPDTWDPTALLDYDLAELEQVLELLSEQLEQAIALESDMVDDLLVKINQATAVFQMKGGVISDDSEDEAEDDERERDESREEVRDFETVEFVIKSPEQGSSPGRERTGEEEDHAPPSPDRSAFAPPTPPSDTDERPATREEAFGNSQILSIASQLVDLHSSSQPNPSLHVTGSALEEPRDQGFSSHFRRGAEGDVQPKLDDPINLPPPPATMTDVNEPVESEQQDAELDDEIVLADEQTPEGVPPLDEMKAIEGEDPIREQLDQVDTVEGKADHGFVVIDDDAAAGFGDAPLPQARDDTEDSVSADAVPQTLHAKPNEAKVDDERTPATSADTTGSSDEAAEVSTQNATEFPARDDSRSMESAESVEIPTAVEKAAASHDKRVSFASPVASLNVPPVHPPVSAISNPTSFVDAPAKSPFVPLPASSTPAINRASGPDLSRFSSHFRYEPDGPPPKLDDPVNLPAPPNAMTSVDEPVERDQRDEELEPELEVAREDEVPRFHRLDEMVDLSRERKPSEADDFETRSHDGGMMIIDDDEDRPAPPAESASREERPPDVPVSHRSRIGATPPSAENDPLVVEGSAPPQNPDILPSPAPSPPPVRATVVGASASHGPIESIEGHVESKRDVVDEADEIRFDDFLNDEASSGGEDEETVEGGDDDDDYSSSSENDEVEAAAVQEMLSPVKNRAGVLGLPEGEARVGATIVYDDDSDSDEEPKPDDEVDHLNSDVEREDDKQVSSGVVPAEEDATTRSASEAPSSEPISYNSEDERGEDEEERSAANHAVTDFEPMDFGGGEGDVPDGEKMEHPEDFEADEPVLSQSLRIHDVVEPGEWDPAEPIVFGDTAAAPEAATDEQQAAETLAQVEEEVVEALTSALDSRPVEPEIEVAPEVIEEALRDDSPTSVVTQNAESGEAVPESLNAVDFATPSSSTPETPVPDQEATPAVRPGPSSELSEPAASSADDSDSGDEVVLMSSRARHRAIAPPTTSQAVPSRDRPSPVPRAVAAASPSPSAVRRSSRLSSAAPLPSPSPSPAPEESRSTGSSTPVTRGKRSRKSGEAGPAASGSRSSPNASPAKRPRRSGHSSKLREVMTDDEEPVSAEEGEVAQGSLGLMVHHHHRHPVDVAPPPGSTKPAVQHVPVTRSRCHYNRLRIRSPSNSKATPYEFLVPACALSSQIARDTISSFSVTDLGPVDESDHCRGTALGGRGFDSSAKAILEDRHPSNLVRDEHVLDIVRRIVGNELYDEGEVEVLPREQEAVQPDEEEEMEEGEIREDVDGEKDAGEEDQEEEEEEEEVVLISRSKGKKRASEPAAQGSKGKRRR